MQSSAVQCSVQQSIITNIASIESDNIVVVAGLSGGWSRHRTTPGSGASTASIRSIRWPFSQNNSGEFNVKKYTQVSVTLLFIFRKLERSFVAAEESIMMVNIKQAENFASNVYFVPTFCINILVTSSVSGFGLLETLTTSEH